MQATEMFVEQLLIGMLAAVTIVCLAAPDALWPLTDANAGLGALLLGGAYVLGIIYDRYADTLLEDMEQYQRLITAIDQWKKRCKTNNVGVDISAVVPSKDPFEEDTLRLALLKNEQLGAYGTYLRSRIRLTRAAATLLPALSLGAVMLAIDSRERAAYRWLPIVVLLAYAIPFVVTVLRGRTLPRTDELTTPKVYQEYWARIGYADKGLGRALAEFRLALSSRAMIAALILTVVATVILLMRGARQFAPIPLLGFFATLFVGWTWWRITKTFHGLLNTVSRELMLVSQPAPHNTSPKTGS